MQIFDLYGTIGLRGENQVKKSLDNIGKKVDNLSKGMSKFGGTMTKMVTLPLLGIGGAAIKTTMDFDVAMSKMQGNAQLTGEQFEEMRKLALKMGRTTSKTATEAADALGYMALAGWDVKQMNEGLEPVLRASEAGMMDLGETSDLVTDSMAALGIGTDQLSKYLDIAAKAQSSSNQSMKQFLTAMVTSGGSFKMFNTPLEEAGSLLGILANRGYKGAEAGNALISIMANLTTGTGKAGDAMSSLGVEIYDGNQEFRGMTVILKDLNSKFADMTEEQRNTYIQMIGGKTRTKELNALLNGTSEELDTLTAKLYDSEGALSKLAKTMQDNLKGQITRLKSAFEGFLILIGDKMTPYLEKLANVIQKVSDKFMNLSPETQNTILLFGVLLAAIGPLLYFFGALGGAIGVITAGFGTLTAGLVAFATKTEMIEQMHYWWSELVKVGNDLFELFKAIFSDDIYKAIDILTEKFGLTKEEAGEFLVKIFTLQGKIEELAQKINQVLINQLKKLFRWIVDNRKEIIIFIEKVVDLADGFVDFSTDAAKAIKDFASDAKPAIKGVIGVLKTTWDFFMKVDNFIKNFDPKKLLPFANLGKEHPKNYSGTMNFQGGLTSISERGPELAILPKGTRIHTAGETMSMYNRTNNNATNNVYNINVALNAKDVMEFNSVTEFVNGIKEEAVKLGGMA